MSLYLLKVGFVGLGNTSEFKHGMIAIFKDVNQELFVTIDWGIVFCSFKLFPTLSKQCTTKNLIFEFAKHIHDTYSSTNNKSSKPFMVIHFDV